MKSLTLEKRTIFVITSANEKDISEVKFKLAGLQFGYGKYDHAHYWSLPHDKSKQGYDVLINMFDSVQRL